VPRGLAISALWWLLASASACDGTITAAASDAAPVDAARPDADPQGRAALPVLFIDTGAKDIPGETKIPASLAVVEQHDGTLVGLASRPRSFEGPIGIEIRGNTSANSAKHSYGMETHDALGGDLDIPLLGMPPESDWVLYGAYNDKTYLRDRLAFELGQDLGRYQPRSRFVELFLNDRYEGVYLVVEKIKRNANRVNIARVAPAAPGDLTGGYIIKREGTGQGEGWTSKQGTPWEYHYPSVRTITPEQAAYLHAHVDAFEDVMQGPDFADAQAGYEAWIDVPSFVDYAIIQELSRNVDGYRKSAYMYKEADADGGLFYMGPLWDFNLAFGNADYCRAEDVTGFQVARDGCEDELEIPAWWPRLAADPRFASALRCRWNVVRQGVLSDAAIAQQIAADRELLRQAEPRDHERWPTLDKKLWPNPVVPGTYDGEIDYLVTWTRQRAAWLDANLPGTCP
jgi:hypothetical protein